MNRRGARRLTTAVVTSVVATATWATSVSTAVASDSSDDAGGLAAGLIVRTDRSAAPDRVLDRIYEAVDAESVERTAEVAGEPGKVLVQLDAPLSRADADRAVAEVADLPGVRTAEPNWVLGVQKAPPVRTDDTYFTSMLGLWDPRDLTSENPHWQDGGFSSHAPELWRATRGSAAVTVAVIDSGVTKHPDLDANRLPGYDFVSDTADPSNRDGQRTSGSPVSGWDSDASDPGDWSEDGQCSDPDLVNPPSTPGEAEASSWHGTHVAGILAAIDDNKRGVVGVAPNVRFQPVRVTGPCGGTTDDVATAIAWSSGATIAGVKKNPTPARVVNLSLGGAAGQACGPTLQDAVDTARQRGTVVVAAAANRSTPSSTAPLSAPASCEGVIAVTAIDEMGQATSYSSQGTPSRRADLSATGGSQDVEGYSRIRSTYNANVKRPGSASYGFRKGTSMATPHVAGAAALLATLKYTGPQIEDALHAAVRPYPSYGTSRDCTSSGNALLGPDCGRGILDLGLVPALYGSRTISGTARSGRTLTLPTKVTGVRGNDLVASATVAYQWLRAGTPIDGATASSYRLTSADRGQKISVTLTVQKQGFQDASLTAKAVKVAR